MVKAMSAGHEPSHSKPSAGVMTPDFIATPATSSGTKTRKPHDAARQTPTTTGMMCSMKFETNSAQLCPRKYSLPTINYRHRRGAIRQKSSADNPPGQLDEPLRD